MLCRADYSRLRGPFSEGTLSCTPVMKTASIGYPSEQSRVTLVTLPQMSLDANIFARMAQEEILPRETARVRKVIQISTIGPSGEGLGVYRSMR